MRKYIAIALLGVIAVSVIAQTDFDRNSYVLGTRTVEKYNMWLSNSPSPHENYDGLLWLSGLEQAGNEFRKDDDWIKRREYLYGQYFGAYGVLVWPLAKDDEPGKDEIQAYLAEAIPAVRLLAADSLPENEFAEAVRLSKQFDLESWPKKIPSDSIALYSIVTAISAYYHQPGYSADSIGDPMQKDFGRFAEGLADGTVLGLQNLYDMPAYEFGKITGRSILGMAFEDEINGDWKFDYDDFLAGVRAGLGLVPALMTADEIKAFMEEELQRSLADTVVTEAFESADTINIEDPDNMEDPD